MKIDVRARNFGIKLELLEKEADDLVGEIRHLESAVHSALAHHGVYVDIEHYPALCHLSRALKRAGSLLTGETYLESTRFTEQDKKELKKRKKK